MMDIHVLDENNDCITEDKAKKANSVNKNLNFKRKLILQVRKHRLLYDNNNKLFSNVAKRELVWQQIAKDMKANVEVCKNIWIELRYGYQRHARRLHKYFLYGHRRNGKRPVMYLESELMFLWRFIENRKTCDLPFTIDDIESKQNADKNIECQEKDSDNNKSADDDLILVEQPVELIVIDEDDEACKTEKQFKISNGMKMLIAQIKSYPELYDTENLAFKDYTRKSYIWNAIAGNLGDKATKLMKCWIIMQTRYEWEICHPKPLSPTSELQVQLEFFKKYILNNPDTVYKQSYYLKTAWYDPIDYFKDIYNLIVRMKKISDIVYITDSLLKTPNKSKQYLSLWWEVANLKGNTAGQCETTWLIMRHFYWELMYMRQQNYQLTDKWYFETIITELYAISKAAQKSKQQEQLVLKQNKQEKIKKSSKMSTTINATSLGLTNTKITATTQMATTMINNVQTVLSSNQTVPTIINNLQSVSSYKPILTTTSASVQPIILPKISAAISLAPQSSLQIKPVSVPQNMPMQTTRIQPQTTHILNGMATTTTTSSSCLSSSIPPQMSLSFNLPSQTKVTSVSIPPATSAIRPLSTTQTFGRNSSQTMIAIRPSPKQMTSKNTITTSPTIPNITIRPQMSSVSISTTTSSTSILCSSMAPVQTPISITSLKLTTPIISNMGNQITLPVNNTTGVATAPSSLPKIASAVSLLNPNEILIELIASQNGNHLVVHGPPLSARYQLPMPTVAKFIREVLAIPLLHNKRHNQPSLINSYWEHISKKFNLPLHICRACWNFLLQNFNHFPQIAPLKELMKPFQTSLTVWKESSSLFKMFDELCVSKGWLQYMPRLPEVVECISGYPVLYQDISKESGGDKLSDMEILCAWRTISLRFPKIHDVQEIWKAIKNCFCQYMLDLEFGIDNKWPINWWRALARLKFLVEAKYSTNEPFYYIVSNKMVEEIERCAMMEMKARYKTPEISTESPVTKAKDAQVVLGDMKVDSQKDQPETSDLLSTMFGTDASPRKDIETVTLLTAIQKYPVIYNKANIMVKYEAWKKVAKELQMDVSDCMLAFRHATQKYFAYKKRDPVSRCRLNERYYKRFDEIVRCVSSTKAAQRSKLNVKTPSELNQSFESGESSNLTDLVFPERYISDISMSNCPSNLVVKNWKYALGNISTHENLSVKLRAILNKYLTVTSK